MFRSVCVTLLLLQVAFGLDISKTKFHSVVLTDQDLAPKGQTKLIGDRSLSNIGDVEIGRRQSDEWNLTRRLQIINPSNSIESIELNVAVQKGSIHYFSFYNEGNSQAVGCASAKSLGGSILNLSIRAYPNSESFVIIEVAAH